MGPCIEQQQQGHAIGPAGNGNGNVGHRKGCVHIVKNRKNIRQHCIRMAVRVGYLHCIRERSLSARVLVRGAVSPYLLII